MENPRANAFARRDQQFTPSSPNVPTVNGGCTYKNCVRHINNVFNFLISFYLENQGNPPHEVVVTAGTIRIANQQEISSTQASRLENLLVRLVAIADQHTAALNRIAARLPAAPLSTDNAAHHRGVIENNIGILPASTRDRVFGVNALLENMETCVSVVSMFVFLFDVP
jgi:hypothetical protein